MDPLVKELLDIIFILNGALLSASLFLIGLLFSVLEGFKLKNSFRYTSMLAGLGYIILNVLLVLFSVSMYLRFTIIVATGSLFALLILKWLFLMKIPFDWKMHKGTLAFMSFGISTALIMLLYATIFLFSAFVIYIAIIVLGMIIVSITLYAYLSTERKAFYELIDSSTIGIILLSVIYMNIFALSLYFLPFLDEFYVLSSIVAFFLSLFMFLEFLISYYSTKYYYSRTKTKMFVK